MVAGGGAVQLQLGIDSGVLAGRISVIADALPQIISVPLFGLRSDSCSGRPADDCAGSRTARSARQNAAENAADDGASPHCAADRPLARRRRGLTVRPDGMTAAYSDVTPSSATAATDQDFDAVVPTYLCAYESQKQSRRERRRFG